MLAFDRIDALAPLIEARKRLSTWPAEKVARRLEEAARRWLDPADPLRREALAAIEQESPFTRPALEIAIDRLFGKVSADGMLRLLPPAGAHVNPITLYILAGNVPGVGLTSILFTLLTPSAVLIKPPSAQPRLAQFFVRSLRESASELADAVAVVPSAENFFEELAAAGGAVVAYGRDETMKAIAAQLPPVLRFLPQGERISLAIVAEERIDLDAARAGAFDASLYDQMGCLSPQIFYVEGELKTAERFAALLAQEMGAQEKELPRKPLDLAAALRLRQYRGAFAARGAALLGPVNRLEWTVALDPSEEFIPSPLGRFAIVKPIGSIGRLPDLLSPVASKISTIGIASSPDRRSELEGVALRCGASRVSLLGEMQDPPLGWHLEGQVALASP